MKQYFKNPMAVYGLIIAILLNCPIATAQWVKVVNGVLPANAFKAGNIPNHGDMYIARASSGGHIVVGKTVKGWKHAAVPINGEEKDVTDYEVYTGRGMWASRTANGTPVQGGNVFGSTPIYVARTKVNGEQTVGGYTKGSDAMMPWGGKENKMPNYEILLLSATPQGGTTQTITLNNIENELCPFSVLRGDREFDGHGPMVTCSVDLRVTDDGQSITADINFTATETVHDWSQTNGKWAIKVYNAPSGKRIQRIISDTHAETEFLSGAAGFQLIIPGTDFMAAIDQIFTAANQPKVKEVISTQFGFNVDDARQIADIIRPWVSNGNKVYQVPSLVGHAVRLFHIVGDTGGPDISDDTNCNDDTRIVKIQFNPVGVVFDR
jgi:hypothetical protein